MPKTIKQLIENYQKEIQQTNPNKSTKVYTGLQKIDFHTEGFSKGTFNLVCARPRNGLKAFRNILLNNCDLESIIFSDEKEEKFLYSFLSHKTAILVKKLSEKSLAPHEKQYLLQSIANLKNTKTFIKHRKTLSVEYLENFLKKNKTIEFILIENLEAFIEKKSYLLKSLKEIAKKFNILIITFFKLKDIDKTKHYEELQPNLDDLETEFKLNSKKALINDSVQIKLLNLVDKVTLLFRPEYYGIEKFCKNDIFTKNKADISIYSKKFNHKSFIVGFNALNSEYYDLHENLKEISWLEKLKRYAEE